jgi:hypothetical protein
MTKFILAFTLTMVALQAEDTVHYDQRDTEKPAISRPNHPGDNLYINK